MGKEKFLQQVMLRQLDNHKQRLNNELSIQKSKGIGPKGKNENSVSTLRSHRSS